LCCQENGGKWRFVTSTTAKSIELNFELGVEFEETTPDGRQARNSYLLGGGRGKL
jgi:hypothetical protein